MNKILNERLYSLLPQAYHHQDKRDGGVLRALLSIMEQELKEVENNSAQSYANLFIETCEDEAMLNIAKLLGVDDLTDRAFGINQRSQVANTLGYRRRKGNIKTLEKIINDTTGWSAKVVDFSKFILKTQHLFRSTPLTNKSIDLRDLTAMRELDGAFDQSAHLMDTKSPEWIRAKYQFKSLGVFIHRLTSYPVIAGMAREVPDRKGCYTFNTLGFDTELFQSSQTLSQNLNDYPEANMPISITSERLVDDLNEYKSLSKALQLRSSRYYGPDKSFYIVRKMSDGVREPVNVEDLVVMDLKHWQRPKKGKVGIDVKRGRIIFPEQEDFLVDSSEELKLEVNYHYGFCGDVGGGHYERRKSLLKSRDTVHLISVSKHDEKLNTLQKALQSMPSDEDMDFIIQIEDDDDYGGNIPSIELTEKRTLTIQAADGSRPVIRPLTGHSLSFVNKGTERAFLELNGLILNGPVRLKGNIKLLLSHCTCVPYPFDTNSVQPIISSDSSGVKVEIDKSILLGSVSMPYTNSELIITDSIIDANEKEAIYGSNVIVEYKPSASIHRSTIFGKVHVSELNQAVDSIFTQPVAVENISTGEVRYCYLPIGSKTPLRYRCQPETNYDFHSQQTNELPSSDGGMVDSVNERITLARLKPRFISRKYGNSGYAQLASATDVSLLEGAENGSEVGVFNHLEFSKRGRKLNEVMKEYVPFGLNAKLFFLS